MIAREVGSTIIACSLYECTHGEKEQAFQLEKVRRGGQKEEDISLLLTKAFISLVSRINIEQLCHEIIASQLKCGKPMPKNSVSMT